LSIIISDLRVTLTTYRRHLKPGGYLELQEVPSQFLTDDNSLKKDDPWALMSDKFYEAAAKAGLNFLESKDLKGYMDDQGFQDLDQTVLKLPLGTWPKDAKLKEIGKYHLLNVSQQNVTLSIILSNKVLVVPSSRIILFGAVHESVGYAL